MITALTLPRRELQPSLKRYVDGDSAPAWDVYIEDRLVASEYASQTDARMELDFAAWYALFGETVLNSGALITDEALGLAVQVFNRLFSAEKIQEKAFTAREKIVGPGIYSIQSDGSLSVLASSSRGKQSTYAVSSTCTCKDYFTHAQLRGGVCKHIAARMLLVLAQHGIGYLKHLRDALDAEPVIVHPIEPNTSASTNTANQAPEAPASEELSLAFLHIGATDLIAAMFLAQRSGTPVEIHAEHGTLRLVAGAIDLSIASLDGSDVSSVRLDADTFAALYEELRPIAKYMHTLTIFVAADGTVIINSQDTDFSTTAYGTPIAILQLPAGIRRSARPRETNSQAVEALSAQPA